MGKRLNILIYGSTVITEVTVNLLSQHHNIVGYIRSKKPTVPGKIRAPKIADEDKLPDHDIKLSIQYDRRIHDIENAYNIHTGLLPMWGGCNILSHSKKEGVIEQGLTFHKMTDRIDHGPILSKVTYNIYDSDKVIDLYRRIMQIIPGFTLGCMNLIEENYVKQARMYTPRVFRKNMIDDIIEHNETLIALNKEYNDKICDTYRS